MDNVSDVNRGYIFMGNKSIFGEWIFGTDMVLWFVILFLLLFWCLSCSGTANYRETEDDNLSLPIE